MMDFIQEILLKKKNKKKFFILFFYFSFFFFLVSSFKEKETRKALLQLKFKYILENKGGWRIEEENRLNKIPI